MKYLILICSSLLAMQLSFAQEVNPPQEDRMPENTYNLNHIRWNLVPLLSGNITLEYERVLNKKIAVAAAVGWRPSGKMPYRSVLTDIIADETVNTFLQDLETSTTSFTPEVRFYLSKRGYGNGFYIAPYMKFAKYDFNVPYAYDVTIAYQGQVLYDRQETILFKGDLSTFSMGLSAGFKFRLTKNIHLDWRILGPGYGQSRGNLAGRITLNADEQNGLNQQLEELQESLDDLPLKFNVDFSVHGNGADIKVNKSPWANIRSGLSIGFSF